MTVRLRLADLLGGFSIVADLGYGLPGEEAMRCCLAGTALARLCGLTQGEVADTFYTALLRHVGCVGFAHEMSAVLGDDLRANRAGARTNFAAPTDVISTLIPQATRGMKPAPRAKAAVYIATRGASMGKRYETSTCEVARATARRVGLPGGVQRGLYEVFEWWNGRGSPSRLHGEEIAPAARVARAAGDAVLFHRLGGTDLAKDALRQRAGNILDPAVVDAFTSNADALMEEATAGDPREGMLQAEPRPVAEVDGTKLPEVAAAFGDITDLKMPFTHGHSAEVARLAELAARRLGLDDTSVMQLHLAGLVHDLGRAGVSNAVWEKPGRLTSVEWEQARLRPYYAERILSTSPTLEPLAPIVGLHCERLDGSGYHRGCRGRDIPVPARVLACADAFQAMTQRRPHRDALTPDHAAEQLGQEARAGRLDSDAVAAVLDAAGQGRPDRTARAAPAGGLSTREVEVLRLVAEGRSNPEIAGRLHISRRTAEHHVQHVYAKIGVSTRAGAALFALEHDLIPPVG